jgi:glucose-1-phosphate cytidylyltransferase
LKAVILAGGLGTRLMEETVTRPKPMVEIGGLPIIHHIMQIYAAQGVTDFVVAAGYKGEMIAEYFDNLRGRRGKALEDLLVCAKTLNGNVHVEMSSGDVAVDAGGSADWNVEVVDTGAETMTGGRLLRLREWLSSGPFMLTYGDGLANVDLRGLWAHHTAHGRIATLTAVHPPVGQPQLVTGRGGRVHDFACEDAGWINGGYFVFEPEVFDYLAGDQSVLEADALSALARDGELMAFRHGGFWQCMDTLEERKALETMWRSGDAPWQAVCTTGMKRADSRFTRSKASSVAIARRLTRVG